MLMLTWEKNADALEYYKKAAHHFEKDAGNSASIFFMQLISRTG